MSFMVYLAMLFAALVSVVMGLEVVSTPPVRTASAPVLVEPIRHEATVPLAKPSPPPVAQQATPAPARPAPAVTQQQPQQTVSQSSEPAPLIAPEPGASSSPAPACNVQACEAAYRSFTAADCTYQPTDGPRRLCTKK